MGKECVFCQGVALSWSHAPAGKLICQEHFDELVDTEGTPPRDKAVSIEVEPPKTL